MGVSLNGLGYQQYHYGKYAQESMREGSFELYSFSYFQPGEDKMPICKSQTQKDTASNSQEETMSSYIVLLRRIIFC